MSPTTLSSTSSATPRVPSPTLTRHRVSDEFVYSQGPLAYTSPSSDLDIDDTTLGKLLTEAHREYADYRNPEGVSVSQSSLSVVFDRTAETCGEKEISISQLVLVSRETRTVLTASFLKTPKLRKCSIEQGNLMSEKVAQMHRLGPLLDEQRHMIIVEYCEKSLVITNSKQLDAEEERRTSTRTDFGVSKLDFREVHQQSLTEMEELRKFQKFYLRYARKTKAHRGSEHYYGIIRKSTRTTK